MSKATDGNTRRDIIVNAAAISASALVALPTVANATPATPSPLYLDAVNAYQAWFDHCEVHLARRSARDPEYARLSAENDALCYQYGAAIRPFLDFALEEPTLQRCGEVSALWRLHCWDGEEEIALMDHPYDRTLQKMLAKLTVQS